MKNINIYLSLVILFYIPLNLFSLPNQYKKNCSENGGCLENNNGCIQISGLDELDCIQQYFFSQNHIVGKTTSSQFFVLKKDAKAENQFFDHQHEWAAYILANKIGPIPTDNISKLQKEALTKEYQLSNQFHTINSIYEANNYLLGEGLNHHYFIFDEKNQMLQTFDKEAEWQSRLEQKNIVIKNARWMSGIEPAKLWEMVVQLDLIALIAIGSLIAINLLFLSQLFSNFFYRPYRSFGVSFVALEIVMVVYLMVF